jgi:hypothetical protein
VERLLDPLRDTGDLPPSTVDVDRAIRSGRRRLRVRRVGAGVAVVTATLVVPAVAVYTLGPGGAPPAISASSAPPSAAPEPDTGFDPMRRVVTIGQVPGVAPESYTTARHWQTVMLQAESASRTAIIHVVVYAPGRQATYGPGGVVRPETGTPAEPVGGRPAYWLDRGFDGGGGTLLAWRWAGDAWGLVYADDLAGDERSRELLHRLASAVQVRPGEPVTVPFTVPPPAPYRLVGTTTQLREPGDPFVRIELVFASEDQADPNRVASHEYGVSVAVENGSKMGSALGANQTVDGHPARVTNGEVIIFGLADGFAVDVQGAGGQEALLAVARSVTLVPRPADKATWTGQPLR